MRAFAVYECMYCVCENGTIPGKIKIALSVIRYDHFIFLINLFVFLKI